MVKGLGLLKRVFNLLNDRQNLILNLIEEKGDISIQDISEMVNGVSVMTIRRDLALLEREGHIIRTMGGALSLRKLAASRPLGQENEYSKRARENLDAKYIVAKKALQFISLSSSIFFDSGSTIMSLARSLTNDRYNIVTTGANIAQELALNTDASVMMPGGTINKYTLSVSGPLALEFIDKINIETAFMSASAFSLDSGFSVANIYEAELKNKVIKKANKSIMLIDSSKIDKKLMFTVCDFEDLDILITDKTLAGEYQALAKEKNLILI